MNLINAAESIVKSRADEYAFIMNSCVQDQTAENLDKFLKALATYQTAVSTESKLDTVDDNED